jgi:hypothetical protein
MKRRYEANHKIKDGDDKPPRLSPIATLKARLQEAEDQLATAKKEIAGLKLRSTDGSLFDLHKDTAGDIAETAFRHVGLARTRGLRDALTQVIKREEAALRRQPKPAG